MISSRTRILFALCIGTVWLGWAFARYGGPGYLMNMAVTGAPGEINCTACHTSNAGNGSLQLEITQGPTIYQPGATYQMRATINAPGSATGGIQIVAIDSDTSVGAWAIPTGMRQVTATTFAGIPRRYIEHSNPQVINNQGLNQWTFTWTAPMTKGLSPVLYASAVAANDDFSPSGDLVFQTFMGMSSLPVSWGEVTAKAHAQGVEINWETESETNTAWFEVQRSIDGHGFSPFATVQAAGNSSVMRKYKTVDQTPVYGSTSQYRIRQVDVNGSTSFSPLVEFFVEKPQEGLLAFFPNKVNAGENIHISFASQEDEMLDIQFQLLDGRRVQKQQRAVQPGTNSISVDTRGLEPAWYAVIISTKAKTEVRRVLVL
ncbi:MAG: choice-of-anchor V domain-containing protein [Bacteroidia bacterium]